MDESLLESSTTIPEKGITLELGDIIELKATTNPELNENTFYVNYIDDAVIELNNVTSYLPVTLHLDEHGILTDESIEQILLLSRSEEPGYARQHHLVPKTWVDLHFGGEVPLIITGEITNLEDDMIEITSYPAMDVFYIDFAYKGLPKDIPLEQIIIRSKPASLEKISSLVNIRDQVQEEGLAALEEIDPRATMQYSETGDIVIQLPDGAKPDTALHDELQEELSANNDIIYGEDLGVFTKQVEIPEHRQRFSLETQVNDMLDELLMNIPESKRSKQVLDQIQLLIQRYRELREEFSVFDENGNVKTNVFLGDNYKPLVHSVYELEQKLKWIVPVTALRKKIYTDDHNDTYQDVIQMDLSQDLKDESNLQESYSKNQLTVGINTPYVHLYQQLNSYMTPMERPLNVDSYLTAHKEVKANMETIVNNLEDYYSTVLGSPYRREKFVIQKYNLGSEHLKPSVSNLGKKVYVRSPTTPNDHLTLQSLMALPLPVIHFSKIDLPLSSIMTKSNYGMHFFQMFKYFRQNLEITNVSIDSLHEDESDNHWKTYGEDGSLKRMIQDFQLDEQADYSPENFKDYLQALFPKGETLVRLLEKLYPEEQLYSLLSLQRVSTALEPFLIYTKNLNYSQYNSARYFVKMHLKKFITELDNHKDAMERYKRENYEGSVPMETAIIRLFGEKQELLSVFLELYKFKTDQSKKLYSSLASSEFLLQTMDQDYNVLFFDLIRFMMHSLIVPEELMKALEVPEKDDMTSDEKIKAGDCARRVLAKKYDSLDKLFKDNHNSDVFYDKEYDHTPYKLKDKYKEERNKYSDEDFIDFLEEALLHKHEIPPKYAREMAVDIVYGKKKVREGEYAVVEIKPDPKKNLNEDELTPNQKREMAMESELRKKVAYYRRMKNEWVVDQDIDEHAFVESNDLFCNMSKICFRDQTSNQCESIEDAKKRLLSKDRASLLKEFDTRFAMSSEELEVTLKNKVDDAMKHLKALQRLYYVKSHKYNLYAYELGRYAKENETVQSPYMKIREEILGQGDFVKKQGDIVKFAELFCREPLVEQLGEDPYYLYCKESNAKLLPTFFLELAQAFVSTNNYLEKLGEIVRKQGTLSDDGSSIVDKHSGYVLRKIDNVAEEQYDESGFKIATSDVLEQDIGQKYVEMMVGKQSTNELVFEDPETQMIFNLYRGIARNIGLPLDSIQEKVMRMSQEIMKQVISSKQVYEDDAKRELEQKKRKMPPYEIYRNKSIILIVTSVILYCIQTAIPSFKIHKTFPGCVRSFEGFPDKEGSMENTTGLDYLVCILNKMKTKSSKPWNSIKPIPLDILKNQLVQIINATILPNHGYMEAYVKKAEYLIQHPDETIPESLSLQQWKQFLPPVVKFSVEKDLKGLSKEYFQELVEMQIKGDKHQRKHKNMILSKCHQYGLSIIEQINAVVKKKGLLLKTASQMFFTENACCNDKNTSTVLDYFRDESGDIESNIKMVRTWEKALNAFSKRGYAAFLYDPRRTGLTFSSELPSNHFEINVYAAFIHYCHLDDLRPIPEDLIPLFQEKLPGFPVKAPLTEKIEFMKKNGKRFSSENLNQLMNVINLRNKVDIHLKEQKPNRVQALKDFLAYMDERYGGDEDVIFPSLLREKLGDVLRKYNPKVMMVEDSDEIYNLNNWLSHANEGLLSNIADFLERYGNLSRNNRNKLQSYLSEIHMWNIDGLGETKSDNSSMFVVAQFLRNSCYMFSRMFNEMITNSHVPSCKSHDYWNFSGQHNADITHFLRDYYSPLEKFMNDGPLNTLMKEVRLQLIDVDAFLKLIPLQNPFHKELDGEKMGFYTLFDKRTIYLLYCYVYYSIFYEYIKACDDEDLVQMDMLEKRNIMRNAIRENNDDFILGDSKEEDMEIEQEVENEDRIEIEIQVGNQNELKKRVCEMLITFLHMDSSNKKQLDVSYEENNKKVIKSRLREKKLITDFLRDLNPEERKVEDTNKMMKLGRWNVGLQKGLVQYDKGRFDEERKQLFEQMNGRYDLEEVQDIPVRRDAQQMEQDEAHQQDEVYDAEANDIREYRGDDADGAYYEEDMDNEFVD